MTNQYHPENDAVKDMTLRQWYAGQALAGLISTAAAPFMTGFQGEEFTIAKAAFEIADAMIAEGDKT